MGGVRRFAGWLCLVLASSALLATLVRAQISEEDKKKRDAFLKAREEMRTVPSSTPSDSPTPSGKPKAAKKKSKTTKSPSPKPTETPKRAKTVDDDETAADVEEEATPTARKKKRASPTPARKKVREDDDARASTPRPSATAEELAPLPVPSPRAPITTPAAPVTQLPADITIEKSGLQQEQGFEPPPPPPRRRGWWVFGRRESYRYLNNSVIQAIRRAPVQRARWKFIIVHNSGTRQGNARAFDYYHRRVRRMKNGMAYHFVVGNGRSSGDGQIEIGDRWRRQINGGHVHSDYLNNISLGICLVGDFNRDRPTRAQMEASEELIKYLRERCGRAEGRAIGVRPHREMNPPRWATDCPGDAFPYGWFRRF